ncbi:hypothetical protein RJ640_004173 [Escallonia rubra]|uniref:Ornithine aminotransferase n=1 Tax=Escallonia rubra TaxID=112253 RepID=A0AA88QHV8_9ASTE|nr:hypothetical protein RJ640_004173 [Escallonia rubra]
MKSLATWQGRSNVCANMRECVSFIDGGDVCISIRWKAPEVEAKEEAATSTFGGNPLASAVAIASLEVIRDEGLAERSAQKGEQLRHQLKKVHQQFPEIIKEVRGKGLFTAVELNRRALFPVTAYDICLRLKERGILAKPTHDSIIRLTPPLSISSEELQEGIKALHDVFELDLPKMQKEKPEAVPPTTSDNKDNQSLKIDRYIIHSCQEGWDMRDED